MKKACGCSAKEVLQRLDELEAKIDLLTRIQELEDRVQQLESTPTYIPYAPYTPNVPPFWPNPFNPNPITITYDNKNDSLERQQESSVLCNKSVGA